MTPRATYRIQFHEGFTFDDAAVLAPYLAQLGVSHLYASPYLKAHPGSTHGYDIVDHTELNPELGGEAGFNRLIDALAENGLRHILDFVPNHMGVGGSDNAAWLDLLEWGVEGDHAGWFDIDWSPDRTDLRDKILVPFLGDQYGAVLDAGDLVLKFDAQEGSFAVWAHDTHKLPIRPVDYAIILGQDHPVLDALGDAFADLMRWRPEVMRRTRALKAELAAAAAQADVAHAIAEAVYAFNVPAGGGSRSALHALIERQNWKASHFRVAADDINYRRFFNIATLAGLRMELPDLFDRAHRLVFELIGKGQLDGLRIDHIDGLYDPKGYLDKLRRDAPHLPDGTLPYLVVEKILGHDEPLRPDWPVDGTTGYEFTNLLTGLFVRADHADAFARIYRGFTGLDQDFDTIVTASKLQIIDEEMSSELHRLARAATGVARQNTHTADFTFTVLQRAIRGIVAAFPVYRTYIDGEAAPAAADLAYLDAAITSAQAADKTVDASVFVFLRKLLSGDLVAAPRSGYRRSDVFRCAMKLQQYCGPVMAKGVEDTAFYRFNRFVALNEVGGAPECFGISVETFHAANAARAELWPTSMLATSTHDTKRGEDTRARLAALSAMPEQWTELVERWSALLHDDAPSRAPDRNDAYLLFQLLVGTCPTAFMERMPDQAEVADYLARIKAVMTKSFREAKLHSTWVAPDEAYEAASLAAVDRLLAGSSAQAFWAAGQPLLASVARLGARVTFAQTALKLTVPGMPDIYQGAELWDLTMVDPDNRRPVDFEERTQALAEVQAALQPDPAGAIAALLHDWTSGRFKLALTTLLLGLRKQNPALFEDGDYRGLRAEGAGAAGLCAFSRSHENTALIVVASLRPEADPGVDAVVAFPASLAGRLARDVLTGREVEIAGQVRAVDLLRGLPAAVLLVAQSSAAAA